MKPISRNHLGTLLAMAALRLGLTPGAGGEADDRRETRRLNVVPRPRNSYVRKGPKWVLIGTPLSTADVQRNARLTYERSVQLRARARKAYWRRCAARGPAYLLAKQKRWARKGDAVKVHRAQCDGIVDSVVQETYP